MIWIGGGSLGAGAVSNDRFIFERKEVAQSFYRNAGFSDDKIADHIRGIDFTKPVEVVVIPRGTEVIQYQIPGAPLGNYFAYPGTPGSTLGFYTSGREVSTLISKQEIRVLQSTAADTVDDWSMREHGWEIDTPGGGIQIFDTSMSWEKK